MFLFVKRYCIADLAHPDGWTNKKIGRFGQIRLSIHARHPRLFLAKSVGFPRRVPATSATHGWRRPAHARRNPCFVDTIGFVLTALCICLHGLPPTPPSTSGQALIRTESQPAALAILPVVSEHTSTPAGSSKPCYRSAPTSNRIPIFLFHRLLQ